MIRGAGECWKSQADPRREETQEEDSLGAGRALVCWEVETDVVVAQSPLTLCDPGTVACQVPLVMEFSRQDYWSV